MKAQEKAKNSTLPARLAIASCLIVAASLGIAGANSGEGIFTIIFFALAFVAASAAVVLAVVSTMTERKDAR